MTRPPRDAVAKEPRGGGQPRRPRVPWSRACRPRRRCSPQGRPRGTPPRRRGPCCTARSRPATGSTLGKGGGASAASAGAVREGLPLPRRPPPAAGMSRGGHLGCRPSCSCCGRRAPPARGSGRRRAHWCTGGTGRGTSRRSRCDTRPRCSIRCRARTSRRGGSSPRRRRRRRGPRQRAPRPRCRRRGLHRGGRVSRGPREE
jgi:hypothetical protein